MISAVVHTYNEQRNIERCLSSLSFVNEIVVIDMRSTDRTLENALLHKAKIFNHQFTGFVEPARNFGISKAKGRWILIIDADEEVPRSLADEILAIVRSKRAAKDYYRIPRKNLIYGKWIRHSGWWPDYQIRLFKKGYVSWVDKLHGIPMTKGSGFDLKPIEKNSIIHHNYQSIEQYIERLNRYSSISAKELYLKNIKFSFKYLFEVPLNEFVKRYLMLQGYKDGIHGLVLSLLQSFSELVVYMKLWELNNFREEKIQLKQVAELINHEGKVKKYWLTNEMLKKPHDIVTDILQKVKRKLNSYG